MCLPEAISSSGSSTSWLSVGCAACSPVRRSVSYIRRMFTNSTPLIAVDDPEQLALVEARPTGHPRPARQASRRSAGSEYTYRACATSCWTRSRSASGDVRTSTDDADAAKRTGSSSDARADQAMLARVSPASIIISRLARSQLLERRADGRRGATRGSTCTRIGPLPPGGTQIARATSGERRSSDARSRRP